MSPRRTMMLRRWNWSRATPKTTLVPILPARSGSRICELSKQVTTQLQHAASRFGLRPDAWNLVANPVMLGQPINLHDAQGTPNCFRHVLLRVEWSCAHIGRLSGSARLACHWLNAILLFLPQIFHYRKQTCALSHADSCSLAAPAHLSRRWIWIPPGLRS